MSMTKITLIVSSPRKKKSCNFLVDQAINGIKSVDDGFDIKKIYISVFNLTPCNGCDQYLRANVCPLAESDDMRKLEVNILGSSALLIAVPKYFGSVSF